MSDDDRLLWNRRYQAGEHTASEPSSLLTDLDSHLPTSGKAIDVAGGTGRHAIWLAKRGLEVTLADVSDVALQIAKQRAAEQGVSLDTVCVDLEREPFPDGPWDLVIVVHYLWRPMLTEIPQRLAPRGRLVYIQPTLSNLQRHAKPSARFLLNDGELRTLVPNLQIIHYQESWLSEGRHEAVLVAER